MQKLIKKYRKAKGFTLVELLIVIIIIGILAGMMMLSTGSATDKAEATKIVSDMRNIKAAAIMYYADNNSWPTSIDFDGSAATSLDKYLDNKPVKGYGVEGTTDAVNVFCDGTSTGNEKMQANGVREKLKAIATDSGLYSATSGDTKYDGSATKVYMRIK